jgi:L-malate glycosyltransferase
MRGAAPRTVLFLHRGGGQLRGSEDALLSLLDGLDRDLHRPVVLFSDPVLAAPLEARGIDGRLHDFPELMVSLGEIRLPLLRYLRALGSMIRIAREVDAELVFCSGGGPCQLGVPVAHRLGIPSVCLLHHPAPRGYLRLWLADRVDELLFISRFTAGHTRERIGRGGTLIPLGVDARGRYAPPARRDPAYRRMLGIAPGDVAFAQVGALVPHKEHGLLLEAFSRVAAEIPRARLLIVGAGPEEARLREMVETRGLARSVVFTGYVDDPAFWLRHVADAHVLASREEGLGLATLEASACGLPVVGGDGTGVRETIEHGRTGFLFPPGDAAALADAMLRLARDPELRAAMGRAGRELVLDRFSPDAYRDAVHRVLRAHLDRQPREIGAIGEIRGERGEASPLTLAPRESLVPDSTAAAR